jgi:hypothetical protein
MNERRERAKKAVRDLSDKDKVKFLKGLKELGMTYHPATGGITVTNPERLEKRLGSKSDRTVGGQDQELVQSHRSLH